MINQPKCLRMQSIKPIKKCTEDSLNGESEVLKTMEKIQKKTIQMQIAQCSNAKVVYLEP